ncbi:hypothetical protein BN14_06690 [Rhizoctonia solani AG-1 IB]|uniref:Uncharacterized protein n=1 Tax=Thanatephorus cucumeris (strain AG1-IB / isolate 7/3/14) TaxID=1108050 RepID=M5C9Y6_THACB|nr:hypothetical protein BN14_06690 [Rhizoctonia solani AG-1 IB]
MGLRLVGSAYALPQDTTTESASTNPIAHTATPICAPLTNAIAPIPVRAPPNVTIVPTITPPPVHPATTNMSLSAIGTSAHTPLATTSTAPTVTMGACTLIHPIAASTNLTGIADAHPCLSMISLPLQNASALLIAAQTSLVLPPLLLNPSHPPPDDWLDKQYYLLYENPICLGVLRSSTGLSPN